MEARGAQYEIGNNPQLESQEGRVGVPVQLMPP